MKLDLLSTVAISSLLIMAFVGFFSLLHFLAEAFGDWITSKRKINTDVPALKDDVRELKAKVSSLELDLKLLRRFRQSDAALGTGLLDEPHTGVPGS